MDANKKRQLIANTSDACSSMINGVRQLRLSVLDLFTTLADNGPDPHRNLQLQQENLFMNGRDKLYHQQTLSNLATSHSLCTSSTPPSRTQEQQQLELIQYVKEVISSITVTVRSLDQDIMILLQNHSLIHPGESIHLGIDGSLDKHNLYMDLCKSYKTYTKLNEYATFCHALLHQQSLKRIHKRTDNPSSNSQALSRDPRSESVVATFNPYVYRILSRSSELPTIEACLKICEYITGNYSQPFGLSTGVLQISVNRIMKAILVMRGIMIDAVIVKAYHESFASKANKVGSPVSLLAEAGGVSPFVDADDDIDLWSESKYAVFRKLTHHANAAALHFQYPMYPEIAVKSFLVSYQAFLWFYQ